MRTRASKADDLSARVLSPHQMTTHRPLARSDLYAPKEREYG